MATAKRRARRKGGYCALHEEILDSPAYRDLTPAARALHVELLRLYRPDRNGALSLEVRKAAEQTRTHKDTASRAFRELAEHGFIALRHGERWMDHLAREWRITSEPCNGREPTDDWREWQPGKPVAKLPQRKKTRS